MADPYRFPKLRFTLELRFEQVTESQVLLIRDPAGIAPKPLLLIPQVAPLIGCFEGNMSIEDIVQKFAAVGATDQIVNDLVALLDSHLFMESPNFYAAEKRVREDFINSDSRPAALAGSSYSPSRVELETFVDRYLEQGASSLTAVRKGELITLVSPHIDYNRGGDCYGITYSKLRPEQPELYIVIGTSHQYSRGLFHLTKKHFDSPLGRFDCEQRFVTKLAALHGIERSFKDELLHKNEHSLELQIPFLKRIENTRNNLSLRNVAIVPILVGSFYQMLTRGIYPQAVEEYESFVSALASCLRDELLAGTKVCFVAGVDMAHMGKAFGDQGVLTAEKMKEAEARDMLYIESIKQQDKKMMFDHIGEDRDARKICGFPTMYTVIDLFDRLNIRYEAQLFDYRQAVDYERDCAVTFAGMGLYRLITA